MHRMSGNGTLIHFGRAETYSAFSSQRQLPEHAPEALPTREEITLASDSRAHVVHYKCAPLLSPGYVALSASASKLHRHPFLAAQLWRGDARSARRFRPGMSRPWLGLRAAGVAGAATAYMRRFRILRLITSTSMEGTYPPFTYYPCRVRTPIVPPQELREIGSSEQVRGPASRSL